jgi:hypothetical protein
MSTKDVNNLDTNEKENDKVGLMSKFSQSCLTDVGYKTKMLK